MTLIQTQPWGSAQIKFLPGKDQILRSDLKKAIVQVEPDFNTPQDTFVMIDKEGDHTIAQVSSTPEPAIFGADGTGFNALVSVLQQTRDFFKKFYPPSSGSQPAGPLLPILANWNKKAS